MCPFFRLVAAGIAIANAEYSGVRADFKSNLIVGNGDNSSLRIHHLDANERKVLAAGALVPDCRVGRLTRIILYAAAGGYVRPTLGGEKGKPS